MENQLPPTPPETEEEITVFSLKNLLVRLVCLAALGYGLKLLLDRRQLLFAAIVTIIIAGFAFSLFMYLVRVIKGKMKK